MDATRLIHDSPAAGTWNMALDAAIFESVAAGSGSCLRFYQWTPPTLSLGYFQRYLDRGQHRPSYRLPVVRRATGGGAIVHDRELTYSLAVPSENRFSSAAMQLVTTVHLALRRALAEWGITTTLCGQCPEGGQVSPPYLCLQRRAPEDVLLAGHKIAGSAQRRGRRATLLHGSVLLASSEHAAELPGIRELARRPADLAELADAWTRELSTALNLQFELDQLAAVELERARQLESSRYATAAWTRKR